MKRVFNAMLAAMLLLGAVPMAHAQLVTVHKKYTIKTVDTVHNRLAVKYLDAASEPVKEQLLVDVDGTTHVNMNGRSVVWTALRPGMEIDVHGGLEDTLHIKAKTIDVLRLHA